MKRKRKRKWKRRGDVVNERVEGEDRDVKAAVR